MITNSITIFETAIVTVTFLGNPISLTYILFSEVYLYILNLLYILARRWQTTSEPVHTYCTLCFALFHLIPPIEDLFTGANHIKGLLGTRTMHPREQGCIKKANLFCCR